METETKSRHFRLTTALSHQREAERMLAAVKVNLRAVEKSIADATLRLSEAVAASADAKSAAIESELRDLKEKRIRAESDYEHAFAVLDYRRNELRCLEAELLEAELHP